MLLRILGISFTAFILLVLSLLTYQYLPTKIYTYPEVKPFEGEFFYNPYADLNSHWLKANFHAHAHAWSGITKGSQSGDIIENEYKNLNYDIFSVSDYFRLNPDVDKTYVLYIPTYEHGTDIHKSHRHVIGTDKVDFYDITFQFNIHLKQYLIERLKNSSAVLAINHPGIRDGHPKEILEKVSGYDCLEVFNRSRDYTSYWDAVLSAGKPVWLIANDDTHDVLYENNSIGISWTMLNVDKKSASEVLNALASGTTYGVQMRNGLSEEEYRKHRAINENSIQFLKVEDHNIIKIKLEHEAEYIRLIGQNGRTVIYAENTDYIEYEIQDNDTYLRTEISNSYTRILLNPIIRYDGVNPPINTLQSKTHWGYTLLFRLGVIVVDFIFVITLIITSVLRKEQKRRKRLTTI